MQLFVFVFAFICFYGKCVSGDVAVASNEGDKQHSSVFLMMYKFMDDIFAIKNQMSNLQNAVEEQEEEIRQLKYVNDQLESQINEKGQNQGTVLSVRQ